MNTSLKLTFFVLVVMLSSCAKEVRVGAIVKEKAAGYNRNSMSFEYHTIVQTDDGYIEDIEGIRTYSYPIGTRITITVWR